MPLYQSELDPQSALDEMKEGRGKYLLINLVAQRVRQMHRGDRALVEHESTADPVEVALEELRQDKWKLAVGRKVREETDSEFVKVKGEEEEEE